MNKTLPLFLFLLYLGIGTASGQIQLGYVKDMPSALYVAGHLKKDIKMEDGQAVPDDTKCYFVSEVRYLPKGKVKDVALMTINGKQVQFESALRNFRGEHDFIPRKSTLFSKDGYRVDYKESGSPDKNNWRGTITVRYKNQTKTIVLELSSMGD